MRAREYLRVSQDRSGRKVSTTEQHQDNQAAATGQGWDLGEPYRDDDRSASRYATKAREDFDRLVADLQADRFQADVLILWESSRGSRREGEWVTLLDLLERRRVKVYVTAYDHLYDPGNGHDRKVLLSEAVESAYASWQTSVRVKRSHRATAAKGRPNGKAPFGYRRTYDPDTGKLAKQVPDPVEAPLVRELFTRMIQGHSMRSITLDWQARGITNRSGTPFSQQHLRSLVANRCYVGEREYAPGRVGRSTEGVEVTIIPADWPALVSKSDWTTVQRILADPKRLTVRPGRATHLLSMIARCSVCGGPMCVSYRGRKLPAYECRDAGHMRVDEAQLDRHVEDYMLGYLARPDVYDKLADTTQVVSELAAVRDDLVEARRELEELRAAAKARKISVASVIELEPALVGAVEALEAREQELATPSRLRGLITPGADVARRWKPLPMASKREVARLLLVPELLGELQVLRAPAGVPVTEHRNVPITERVKWERN